MLWLILSLYSWAYTMVKSILAVSVQLFFILVIWEITSQHRKLYSHNINMGPKKTAIYLNVFSSLLNLQIWENGSCQSKAYSHKVNTKAERNCTLLALWSVSSDFKEWSWACNWFNLFWACFRCLWNSSAPFQACSTSLIKLFFISLLSFPIQKQCHSYTTSHI